jgi:MscS family membrane protein
MKSFMEAMDDYRIGKKTGDPALEHRIEDAIRTFNLEGITHSDLDKFAKDAAIYLKETIDRVIVIQYPLIPGDEEVLEKSLQRWRLKDTEIKIVKITEGEREGEYLFSRDTITRAKSFYTRVKHLKYLPKTGGGAGFEPPWYEQNFPKKLKGKTFYVPNWQILGSFIAIVIGLILKSLITFFVDQLKRLTSKSKNEWDDRLIDATEVTLGSVGAGVFWLLSIRLLDYEGNAFLIFDIGIKIMLSYHLVKLAYQLVDVFSDFLAIKANSTEFPLDDQLVPMIRKSLRIFTVVFGVLIAVQNLGVNVMSVLAGLGLGGLAFALAAKDACANMFGSIMILMDKPFRVGDWITAGGVDGTVEEIGFRSTKIRTFYSSLVSVPNSQLANINIDNMGRRKARRIKATLGLTYDTRPEQMEAFLEGMKNIIKANPYTQKDNFHVVFHSYGASSLNVLVYCFLEVRDWAQEMVERQNIYLEALRLAKELKVDFAFPTQTLYVQQEEAADRDITEQELANLPKEFSEQGKLARPSGLGYFTPLYNEQPKA